MKLSELNKVRFKEGKVTEFLESSDIFKMPKNPRLLYHSGYFDGPLSGKCRWMDKTWWFECVDDYSPDEKTWHRTFVIFKLSKEDDKHEKEKQKCFQDWVGTHCLYTNFGKRKFKGGLGPKHELAKLLNKAGITTHWIYYGKYSTSTLAYDGEIRAWWTE